MNNDQETLEILFNLENFAVVRTFPIFQQFYQAHIIV